MNSLRDLAALPLAAALAGCASMPAPRCASGQDAAIQELLYFGTDKPGGRVSAEEWAQFLGDTVTPRFPDGLTVWQASGQWRLASGTVVREPSYVLNLVHPRSAAAETAVQELVAAYKTRFQQEAVLRVQANVCASF